MAGFVRCSDLLCSDFKIRGLVVLVYLEVKEETNPPDHLRLPQRSRRVSFECAQWGDWMHPQVFVRQKTKTDSFGVASLCVAAARRKMCGWAYLSLAHLMNPLISAAAAKLSCCRLACWRRRELGQL